LPNAENPTWQEITVVGLRNIVRADQFRVRIQ